MALKGITELNNHIKCWTVVEKDILKATDSCYARFDARDDDQKDMQIEEGTLLLCLRAPSGGDKEPDSELIQVLHPELGPVLVSMGAVIPHTPTPAPFRSAREVVFYGACFGVIVIAGLMLITADTKVKKEGFPISLTTRQHAASVAIECVKAIFWSLRNTLLPSQGSS